MSDTADTMSDKAELPANVEVESGPGGHEIDAAHMSGLKLWILLSGLCFAVILMAIDTSIVATAIPMITVEFNSTEDIGWYGSAYFLSLCALQPIAGKLFANFSLKWTFLAFFAAFELGSLICGVATSSDMLIVGRAIAGAGGAGLSAGAFAILAFVVPLAKRPAYIGVVAGTFSIATILGPIIGGSFTENVSWRWCFYVNLPVGALTVVILLFTLRPPTRAAEERPLKERILQLDLIGAALFIPTIVMFLFALQWGGNTYPWNSPTIIGLFCGAFVLFIIFGAWQWKAGQDAMIPPQIILRRTVISGCVTTALLFGGTFIVIYYLPEWFQVIKGASPIQSGVMNIPFFAAQMVGTLAAGFLATTTGYYNPWLISGTAVATVGFGLLTTLNESTSTAAWAGYQVLAAIGIGLALQMPVVAVQTILAPEEVPIGIALATFSQFFGSSIFLAGAQAAFSTTFVQELTSRVPGVSAVELLHAGSTRIRDIVSPEILPEVLLVFNDAIRNTSYLATGAVAAAVITCLAMEWKSTKG